MIYEVLENGNVTNTVVASEEFMAGQYPAGNYRVINNAPDPVVTEIPSTQITRLAFLTRFTDAEAIALDLASIGATIEAATIRRYLSKVNAAMFIDLSRQDTIDGVNALVGLGILTAARATEILSSPITESEKYSK